MRFILLFSLLIIYGRSSAQVKETIVSDSLVVGILIGEGDTSFYIKDPYRTDEWIIYYDSVHSKKALHVTYFNSKYRFISTQWYKNGQIKQEKFGRYYLTPLHYNEWFSDGKVSVSTKCAGDSCVTYKYYHNGQLAEKNISRGDSASERMMIWCYFEEYYENGQLKFTPFDPNSKLRQSIVCYYPSGKVKGQYDLMYRMVVGSTHEWYENGKLKTEGNFAEFPDDGQFHNATKNGKWTYYDETGKKIKEEFFEENKLINTITY